LLKLDPHLLPYHRTAFQLVNSYSNYTVLDIKNWNIEGTTQEMRHSNSVYYPAVEKALNSSKLKKRVKTSIDKLLKREYHFYKLLSSKRNHILI